MTPGEVAGDPAHHRDTVGGAQVRGQPVRDDENGQIAGDPSSNWGSVNEAASPCRRPIHQEWSSADGFSMAAIVDSTNAASAAR